MAASVWTSSARPLKSWPCVTRRICLVLVLATSAFALPLEKRMEHRAEEQTTQRAQLQATTMDGSRKLLGSVHKEDLIVTKLRNAGGTLMTKMGLSERAFFKSSGPISGWNGRGGQTYHKVASAAVATDLAGMLTSASQQDFRSAPKFLAAIPELQELAVCSDTDLLHLFLLVFCSQGVGMTEKIEMWVRQAGRECLALADAGSDVEMLTELGNSLVEGALGEAGHDQWLRNDATKLSASWNAKHPGSPMSADALLMSGYFQSVHDYYELHDRYIASRQPYARVAIQSAIEQLSLYLGAPMIARVRELLGDAFLPELTFLHNHVVLDVTHAQESAELRDRFITANPRLEPLFAEATYGVLEVYGRFLAECWNKAKAMRAALN